MKRKNYILTIAIDNYSDYNIPNLRNAKLDAENIQNILLDNYEFDLVEDSIVDQIATRGKIIDTLASLSSFLTPNDNIIIYFAGHGVINKKSRIGYWLPYDAKHDSISTYINNSTIIDSIKAIDVKHLLLISDSCFSGSFISNSRSVEPHSVYKRLNEKSSRWILTSGRVESVSDGEPSKGGPFAIALYNYLINNREHYFSLSDMANYVTKKTSETTNQQPVCSHLSYYNNEGGQMVFKYVPNQGKSKIG